MNEFLSRLKLMLSNEELDNILTKKIILFGVGGVGGSVAEMLVRSGISNLTIVDFDKIDITNINRQIIATHSNIGQLKVEAFKDRLLDINPNLKLSTIDKALTEENISDFSLSNYDYVIDCIDDLKAKKALIKFCYEHKIKILVSCGAGNRYKGVPNFEVEDIYKTSYDAIAKLLRKFCSEERIKHLTVVYTKQKSLKFDCKTIGSVVYYPMSMASVIVAKVINDILL